VFSKSDPLCVVSEFAEKTKEWIEIGRTEFIKNNLNPDFKKSIEIGYYFERHQVLRFEFIDDDGGASDDPYYDIIGKAECTLGDIMGAKY